MYFCGYCLLKAAKTGTLDSGIGLIWGFPKEQAFGEESDTQADREIGA